MGSNIEPKTYYFKPHLSADAPKSDKNALWNTIYVDVRSKG